MSTTDDTGALSAAGTSRRRLGRLAVSDAELNIRLLSRLAEAAITSGDVQTAVEAVRACTAEAEQVFRMAVAELDAAAEAAREAAEERIRAVAMQEAAAEQHARAAAAQESASAQQARTLILHTEAATQHARGKAMREEAIALRNEARSMMAEVEAQRKAEVEAQRKADRRRAMSVPRRMRVSDANGLDLRPDPSAAATSEEYIETLRQFRLWAGNPSFRDLEKRCNGRPVASTIYKVLQNGQLPRRFEIIDAIVSACGGTEEDRARFATAWRQLVLPEPNARSPLRVVADTSA